MSNSKPSTGSVALPAADLETTFQTTGLRLVNQSVKTALESHCVYSNTDWEKAGPKIWKSATEWSKIKVCSIQKQFAKKYRQWNRAVGWATDTSPHLWKKKGELKWTPRTCECQRSSQCGQNPHLDYFMVPEWVGWHRWGIPSLKDKGMLINFKLCTNLRSARNCGN